MRRLLALFAVLALNICLSLSLFFPCSTLFPFSFGDFRVFEENIRAILNKAESDSPIFRSCQVAHGDLLSPA